MRRVSVLLLAGLQLGVARQPSFSIHDDLLAHPQFEVIFSDAYISEHDAQTLLEFGLKTKSESGTDIGAPSSEPTTPSGDDDKDLERKVSETYELMNIPPHKYLCTIPVIAPPPAPNLTETELAKAEEAKEVARATTAGWQLLRNLDGKCLYFVSGWWSYQFCFGEEVVQFHALPANNKGGPPVRDPSLQEYILGRHDDSTVPAPGDSRSPATAGELESVPRNTELAVKGDQRYLVQRLVDGTVCDLTNRPRTIEIQYHCAPHGNTDRIGWIKEITTCSYLMVVYTPRLCRDVAFLPPKETRAHAISYREILTRDQERAWHAKKTLELTAAAQAVAEKQARARGGGKAVVGGVEVGGRRVLGSADENGKEAKLQPPTGMGRGGKGTERVIILAAGKSKEDGGDVTAISDEEVAKLDLDPEFVKQMREDVIQAAQGLPWKLEMVDDPHHGPELRGVLFTNDEDENEADKGPSEEAKGQREPQNPKRGAPGEKQEQQPNGQEKSKQKEKQTGIAPDEEDVEEGSEETFYSDMHDEL